MTEFNTDEDLNIPPDSDNPATESPSTESSSPQSGGGGNATPASIAFDSSTNRSAAATARTRISIGSQRDVSDMRLAPQKPDAVTKAEATPVTFAEDAPIVAEEKPSNTIRSSVGLGDNLDEEIEAALAGMSMDQLLSSDKSADEELEVNSRIKASVASLANDNVFLTLKGRYQGVVPLRQFKKPPSPGDLVEVVVRGINEDEGLYELTVPGASVDFGDWDAINQGDIVECRVTGSNTGGLEVLVNQLRGFIPASQIDRFRVEQFGDFVNQRLQCVVTEINPRRKKLVLSRRAILDREHEEKRREMLASIEVGQTYDGVVTRLMDFGAFVDLGGIEGLVHVSKLSWSHVKHPSEVVQVGQKIRVKVEKTNPESGKFSLSHRDTLEHPWTNIEQMFPVGSVAKGVVSRLAQFGAFVRMAPGIEGLIHISELAHHRVFAVKNHVNEGDEVEVKILAVDPAAQKMSLSLKATLPMPEKKAAAHKDEAEPEPLRPLAVPKTNQPLRGGTTRRGGGDQFGLNL